MGKPIYESWAYKFFWTGVLLLFVFSIGLYPYFRDKLNSYVDHKPEPGSTSKPSDTAIPEGLIKAKVVRVVDGDTLVVYLDGRKERVRLIGIDTPESSPNRKALRDSRRSGLDLDAIVEAGKEAKGYVMSLVKPGDDVYLEFDVQKRDRYGRLLAYVYLKDGRMLNELLLENGYALVYTFPPNVKYVDRFLKLQEYARTNELGFWKGAFRYLER